MSDLSESFDDSHDQSDEEQFEEEFGTHTGVIGYQYEPKKKEKNKSDGKEPISFPAAPAVMLVDPTELEIRISTLMFAHLFYSNSLKWLVTVIRVSITWLLFLYAV